MKQNPLKNETPFQDSPVLKDDYMDNRICKCSLTNQHDFIFSNGKFWNLQNPFWDAGPESARLETPLSPAAGLLLPLAA